MCMRLIIYILKDKMRINHRADGYFCILEAEKKTIQHNSAD